jgi:dTDP-4-dehydrorhamnose 3,5-epimerase
MNQKVTMNQTVTKLHYEEDANLVNILNVEIKNLKTHPDGRGFFREIIRSTDDFFAQGVFGQWSHSKMQKNVVKAWHYHHVQTDWWYIANGRVDTVLFDNREESGTYKNTLVIPMGEKELGGYEVCVKIPPGVLHGCKVVSEIANLFYITSHTYNPQEEGRFPYDSVLVGYDWGISIIVSDNDRREFVPTSIRNLCL